MKPQPNRPLIFEFAEIRAYLGAVVEQKRAHNPRYSLRAWARSLGYRNPSLLADVMHGRRRPGTELAERIAGALSLAGRERRYFDALVAKSRGVAPEAAIEALRPDRARTALGAARFRFIRDWYHLAILEMMSLRDFSADPELIARRLGGKITVAQAKAALVRLRRLGLAIVRPDGALRRGPGNPVAGGEVPSEAIRDHHRQMLMRAREALREQGLAERDFRSTKLAIRKKDYAAAREIILDFHRKMQGLAAAADADEVYTLNTQFFRLTI